MIYIANFIKNLSKYLISFFFLFLVLANICYAAPATPILMYHYIRDCNCPKDPTGQRLSVSPSDFDQEMGYLAGSGYTPISFDTLAAVFAGKASPVAKPIVLTFDDGYVDFYTNAFPILKKYNFHATSFVITGFVGKPAYLSWNNIRELQNSGLITFESHTVNHTYLPAVSYQKALSEVTDSKNALQAQTGYPVNFIAYPSGGSNATVWSAVRNAGYIGGIGTWRGKAFSITMNMPRIRVNGQESLKAFIGSL